MNGRTHDARIHGGQPCSPHDSLLGRGDEPALASHLICARGLYSHHGIYVGDGCVIHYAGFACGWRRGPVERVSLEHFANGHAIRIRTDRRRFDRREVVARAHSRLGERRYRVLTNNCEHFCAWALRDQCDSRQVERLLAAPRAAFHAIRAIAGALRAIANFTCARLTVPLRPDAIAPAARGGAP